jgi:HEAT repeat protein
MRARRWPSDPSARLHAVLSAPAAAGDPGSLAPLLQAVDDPSLDVARAALRRLVELAGRRETVLLRGRLLDVDIGLVGDVAATLRALSDTGAADVVAAGLGAASTTTRHKAAVAARELRDPSSRPALVRALSDRSTPVRRVALEALARLPASAATVAACRIRLGDRDGSVRGAAVDAVAALDGDAAAALAPVALDPQPRVRARLGAVAPALDADTTVALLGDRDPGVREATLLGLAERPRPELAAAVTRALTDTDWHVRRAACDAVAATRAPEAGAALIDALIDPHMSVRGRAVVALEALLGPRLGRALEDALDDAPPRLRRTLIEELGRRRRPEAVRRFAADPSSDVRLAVVHALAGDRSSETRAALGLLSHDREPAVHHAAMNTLAVHQTDPY